MLEINTAIIEILKKLRENKEIYNMLTLLFKHKMHILIVPYLKKEMILLR